MRSKSRVVICQNDLAFLWMRHDTSFEIIAYCPYRSTAKILIHVDMAPNKGVHLHIQTWFYIRILTIRECSDEQIDSDQFTGAHVHVVHGWSGPIDFYPLPGLVLEMVGETIGDSEFSVSLVKLSLAHGNRPIPFTAFDILLMEKLEGHAYFFQLLMYMLVVRISVHGLVRKLLRIEDVIDLRIVKGADIIVMDTFLISDVENLTDRVP